MDSCRLLPRLRYRCLIISEVFNHSQKHRWLMSYFSYWYVLLVSLIYLYYKGYHSALCYLWFILPIDLYLIALSGVLEYININNVSRERSDVETWWFHLWRASLPWHFSLSFRLLTLDRSVKNEYSVIIYSDLVSFYNFLSVEHKCRYFHTWRVPVGNMVVSKWWQIYINALGI